MFLSVVFNHVLVDAESIWFLFMLDMYHNAIGQILSCDLYLMPLVWSLSEMRWCVNASAVHYHVSFKDLLINVKFY